MPDREPSWQELHELAAAQSGHFTSQQAAHAGFSPQLLHKHVQSGNLERAARGIYRIARFPPSEHEDLVVVWLWSDQQGVFSHETALHLHGLSDALPARIHVTLPSSASRRRTVPDGVVPHYADLAEADRQWLGPVPITRPARTIRDIATAHGDATLLAQAIDEGIRADLFAFADVAGAGRYVAESMGDGCGYGAYGVADADGSGRSAYYARWLEGRCSRPPPSDWPELAAEIAARFGAFIHNATYSPSRSMRIGLAFPSQPDDADVKALRTQLARRFKWA